MLDLYLDAIKIGHTFCSMLSILNELTLQNNCKSHVHKFFDKKSKTQQQQNKNANIKILFRAGNRTRNLFHRSQERYIWTTD